MYICRRALNSKPIIEPLEALSVKQLIVAKFGGSTIGVRGRFIPRVIQRIREMSSDAKVVGVFSAPLAEQNGRSTSLTDMVIMQGRNAEAGQIPILDKIKETYDALLGATKSPLRDDYTKIVESHLQLAQDALDEAYKRRRFGGANRAQALAYSGELLMAQVMNYILREEGLRSDCVPYEYWPIITDNNRIYANFLLKESQHRMGYMTRLLEDNDIVCIGGFIGKTVQGAMTTYERGGTDRTAADLGIMLHKMYDTRVDWEKDSAVRSADPKIVKSGLLQIPHLSYNEARLAGMFGMKILDPIAVREILDNHVNIPLQITDMADPSQTTVIQKILPPSEDNPIKIVTGKGNCAIMRLEMTHAADLLLDLDKRKYGEFVLLSPFVQDGIRFARIFFTDADYVRLHERNLLRFDPLAAIIYDRAVITLIGDTMWKVQHVVSSVCSRIGKEDINILNVDAREESSRIVIILEDADDHLRQAVTAVHDEIITQMNPVE